MASFQLLPRTSKSSPLMGKLPFAVQLIMRRRKQRSTKLRNPREAERRLSINSTSKTKLTNNLNSKERSLCLNQYSVLQLHRVKLSELFSNFKLKALQIRKFRC